MNKWGCIKGEKRKNSRKEWRKKEYGIKNIKGRKSYKCIKKDERLNGKVKIINWEKQRNWNVQEKKAQIKWMEKKEKKKRKINKSNNQWNCKYGKKETKNNLKKNGKMRARNEKKKE